MKNSKPQADEAIRQAITEALAEMQDVQDSQGKSFQVDKLRLLARSLVHAAIKGDVGAFKEITRLTPREPKLSPTGKKIGRPTDYKPEFAAQAEKLCKFGCTDRELADFFNVSEWTISYWRAQYPAFSKSTRLGKDACDERIEHSLYHRALGYSFDSEKIFCKDGEVTRVPFREHVPPDTAAASLWLRNRKPEKWRDVHKFEHGQPGDFDRLSDDELVQEIQREAKALQGDRRLN